MQFGVWVYKNSRGDKRSCPCIVSIIRQYQRLIVIGLESKIVFLRNILLPLTLRSPPEPFLLNCYFLEGEMVSHSPTKAVDSIALKES